MDPAKKYRLEEERYFGGDQLMYVGLPLPELSGDFQSYIWKFTAE